MLWTDEIKEYADSLPSEKRKEYMKGLREGYRIANYLFPRRGDNCRSQRTIEFVALTTWLESEKEADKTYANDH